MQVHASDLLSAYGGIDLTEYIVNFVNHLNPNTGGSGLLPNWPQYSTASPQLLTFLDGLVPIILTKDDFRKDAIALLQQLSLEYPL